MKKHYIHPATSVLLISMASNVLVISQDGRADTNEAETEDQW